MEAAPAEEEIDIDLNDPEVGVAATKIQAGFRGLQARKEVKQKKVGVVAWLPGQPSSISAMFLTPAGLAVDVSANFSCY